MLCPNLRHVAIVLPWFGNDLRAGACSIRPGVTHQSTSSSSQIWKVENVTRADAHLISTSGEGAAYGGTPSDQSVIDAIHDAKARGLKVTLYPFIMMDVPADNRLPSPYGGVGQSVYPWRGRITCHPAIGVTGSPDKTAEAGSQVSAFVNGTWGYRRFLNHCANLVVQAGGVDAFLLGSELRGLTSIRDSRENFPFVTYLCALATEMRVKLGSACSITYGADWTEYFGYQAQDGTGDLFFNLDPLWSHPAVDAVGIDNYMPLADWRDSDFDGGNPDRFESPYDLDGLTASIETGRALTGITRAAKTVSRVFVHRLAIGSRASHGSIATRISAPGGAIRIIIALMGQRLLHQQFGCRNPNLFGLQNLGVRQ